MSLNSIQKDNFFLAYLVLPNSCYIFVWQIFNILKCFHYLSLLFELSNTKIQNEDHFINDKIQALSGYYLAQGYTN